MKKNDERYEEAQSYYQLGLQRVSSMPEPNGQKFPNGSRVKIADDLGASMLHFSGRGKLATVKYVYAHAYGGSDVTSYCLDIDGQGSSSWYKEHQLTAIDC